MKSASLLITTVFVSFAVVLIATRLLQGGVAERPSMFQVTPTASETMETSLLDEAMAESEATGKPVLAFVTADWCGPCQVMKKNALVDARVVEFASAEMIPVYLEESASRPDIAKLPVRAFPTTFVIRDGKIVSAAEGVVSTDHFLEFLREATE
ncbi:MAG: thioredoxin family protein [Planctomycetota bacterium]